MLLVFKNIIIYCNGVYKSLTKYLKYLNKKNSFNLNIIKTMPIPIRRKKSHSL